MARCTCPALPTWSRSTAYSRGRPSPYTWEFPVSAAPGKRSRHLASFCRETRFPRVRTLPNGRGSDSKSRSFNETIRAPTVREGLLRRRMAVSRQKLTNLIRHGLRCRWPKKNVHIRLVTANGPGGPIFPSRSRRADVGRHVGRPPAEIG